MMSGLPRQAATSHSFWLFEREGSALDQKGKEEHQGIIVLATRKPRVSNRTLDGAWRGRPSGRAG